MSVARVVHFARCPEHGLHGMRDTCHDCGGPVDQVAYVPEADYREMAQLARTADAQRDRLLEAACRLAMRLDSVALNLRDLVSVIHHLPGVHNPSTPVGAVVRQAEETLDG